MKTNDDYIKKALRQNIQRIEDDSFTNNIVKKHLTDKEIIRNTAFTNFLPLIIGLSIVIISIGLVALVRLNNDWFREIGFKETHGLIVLTISFIFLIYKLMDEITAPNTWLKILGLMRR